MAPPIQKVKKTILISFGIFLSLLIAGIVTLFVLGPEYLIVQEKKETLPSSDAIIVLSGGENRLEHGVELYKDGAADTLILTNALEEGTTEEDAVSMGIPERAIIEETKADSTYENATLSKEIMDRENLTSAIVVTSDYHSRRTKMTFEDIYDKDYSLSYSFSASSFNVEDGLTEKEKKTTFSEYTKLIAYSFRLLFT
ncbi:YdcF family protein [Halobacillus litoralis]|uniref:YdcF family protein n=1 Tax=Halobacillus litoralis TaxID=45668 RepID=UPI001CFDDDC5|nr:YdcF family protein [Halobacillus litoralis]